MLAALLESFLHIPGELLKTSTKLSLVILFFLAMTFSAMTIITFITILVSVLLGCAIKFALPKAIELMSCEKPDSSAIEEILGLEPEVFAHRGAALDAPENTIAAIRLAKKNNAYGVELDLSFTKDDVAIAFHDDDLDRTTNGKGPLSESLWKDIKELDAAHNHLYASEYEGEKVPTIEAVVEEALNLGLKIILDIKEYDDRTVNFIVNLFENNPKLYKNALVASFFPNLVYNVRQKSPQIVTALIWRPYFVSHYDIQRTKPRFQNSPIKQYFAELMDPILDFSIHHFLWHMTGSSAVLIVKDCISKQYLRQWEERQIRVLSWTPNHPIEKEFLLHNNVSLITDTLI